jgi:hypothetical protein
VIRHDLIAAIFVVAAAELAAQPVATRTAMPIDCLNPETRTLNE